MRAHFRRIPIQPSPTPFPILLKFPIFGEIWYTFKYNILSVPDSRLRKGDRLSLQSQPHPSKKREGGESGNEKEINCSFSVVLNDNPRRDIWRGMNKYGGGQCGGETMCFKKKWYCEVFDKTEMGKGSGGIRG